MSWQIYLAFLFSHFYLLFLFFFLFNFLFENAYRLTGKVCGLTRGYKNNQEVPGIHRSASPLVMSYTTLMHYQNQENDIGAIQSNGLQALIRFHKFLHALMHVCIILWNVITCIASCNHHHSQDTEVLCHYEGTSLCLPLSSHTLFPPPSSLLSPLKASDLFFYCIILSF